MTLITHVFPKLGTVNNVARQISNKQRSRAPCYSQHVKGCDALLKRVRQ